jgi:hypothetical protein
VAVSIVRPVETASAAPAAAPSAPNSYFICSPANAAVFSNRVHIKCSNTPGSGVYYFAAATNDSAGASRYLSLITTALVTGKQVEVWYDPAGDGSAWGCGTGDCRPIQGMALLP